MSFDRQEIERRDFPITRRGYDPAAVDAHLRALAGEIEELRHAASGGGEPSLASAAGTQVQGILQAAESAAADIERQASEAASAVREEADLDAARTREEAIEHARAHTAAVSRATSTLLERVAAMDGEASALIDSLHAGATRLARDLQAVEANMGELYDAASGRGGAGPRPDAPSAARAASAGSGGSEGGAASAPSSPHPASGHAAGESLGGRALSAGATAPSPQSEAAEQPQPPPRDRAVMAEREGQPTSAGGGARPPNGDLDGARLVALNMALNGESREETDRYLAENYQLDDRRKLIDEVYAAIEA